jgi:hypothetical protein
MQKRKPIQQYDSVYYKYTPENVEAHKMNPTWYPKINTEGVCTGRHGDEYIAVHWVGFENDWLIEENRVRVKRKIDGAY